MKVEPGGAELLRLARERLLQELLPLLPEHERYAARMVANAMAIAARELEGEAKKPSARALREGARLAADIRAGLHDAPAARARLHEALRVATRERLTTSNPRILPVPLKK